MRQPLRLKQKAARRQRGRKARTQHALPSLHRQHTRPPSSLLDTRRTMIRRRTSLVRRQSKTGLARALPATEASSRVDRQSARPRRASITKWTRQPAKQVLNLLLIKSSHQQRARLASTRKERKMPGRMGRGVRPATRLQKTRTSSIRVNPRHIVQICSPCPRPLMLDRHSPLIMAQRLQILWPTKHNSAPPQEQQPPEAAASPKPSSRSRA